MAANSIVPGSDINGRMTRLSDFVTGWNNLTNNQDRSRYLHENFQAGNDARTAFQGFDDVYNPLFGGMGNVDEQSVGNFGHLDLSGARSLDPSHWRNVNGTQTYDGTPSPYGALAGRPSTQPEGLPMGANPNTNVLTVGPGVTNGHPDNYIPPPSTGSATNGSKPPPFSSDNFVSLTDVAHGTTPGAPAPWTPTDPNNIALDPGYQFRLEQGMKALQGAAAARGQLQSGNTLKGIEDYAQGLASTEFGAADARRRADYNTTYGNYQDQRNFGYARDVNDRDFDYRTQTGDRDFNYGRLRDIAGMGLTGTQGYTANNSFLASALANLIQNGGQIQGTGTAAQGNNVNNVISQILQQYFGSQLLGNLPQGGGGH